MDDAPTALQPLATGRRIAQYCAKQGDPSNEAGK